MKFYLDSLRFDMSIVQCVEIYILLDTVYNES